VSKALLTVLLLGATASMWVAWARSRQAAAAPADKPETDPTDRVAVARVEHGKAIEDRYRAVAVQYPGEIYIRWLKSEALVELWARNRGRRFRLVAEYPILKISGGPGPKRKEGDRQVPEGFYEIDRFNPKSNFHLSLGLNYPNAADLVHADPQQPGSDIFIHGGDQSIGCAPLGDDAIEELYLAAYDAHTAGQKRIAVHVFPARMTGPDWETFSTAETAKRPELAEFWAQLKPGYEAFEKKRLVPEVKVTKAGRYVLKSIED
jgi:murein L,D-transpeptidase YafK